MWLQPWRSAMPGRGRFIAAFSCRFECRAGSPSVALVARLRRSEGAWLRRSDKDS
jgi:hypothetical protein